MTVHTPLTLFVNAAFSCSPLVFPGNSSTEVTVSDSQNYSMNAASNHKHRKSPKKT